MAAIKLQSKFKLNLSRCDMLMIDERSVSLIQLLSQRDVRLDGKRNESNSQSILLEVSSRISFVRLPNKNERKENLSLQNF